MHQQQFSAIIWISSTILHIRSAHGFTRTLTSSFRPRPLGSFVSQAADPIATISSGFRRYPFLFPSNRRCFRVPCFRLPLSIYDSKLEDAEVIASCDAVLKEQPDLKSDELQKTIGGIAVMLKTYENDIDYVVMTTESYLYAGGSFPFSGPDSTVQEVNNILKQIFNYFDDFLGTLEEGKTRDAFIRNPVGLTVERVKINFQHCCELQLKCMNKWKDEVEDFQKELQKLSKMDDGFVEDHDMTLKVG